MSLHIETIVNYPIPSNCFVVSDTARTSHCIVIDPGTESCNDLMNYLKACRLIPDCVILTHEHFDHIAGVTLLKRLYDCKLIASENCSVFIQNPKSNLSLFRDGVGFSVQGADWKISNHDSFEWYGYHCGIYVAKGHSAGGIVIVMDTNLFTGDTLMWNLKTVTKLPTSSKEELNHSLDLIKSFRSLGRMHVYAGHGPDFELDDYEWKMNEK